MTGGTHAGTPTGCSAWPAPPARPHFKSPQFEGNGDLEYFIQQFDLVAEANDWDGPAAFLHLRNELKDKAQDCGKPNTRRGIYAALRARFGFSPREARARLAALRKDYRTSLQEHGAEVARLVNLAYHDLPEYHLGEMMLEVFTNTLGNAYLQRHLLAVGPQSMEEAIRAGNEFLQIKPSGNSPLSKVRVMDEMYWHEEDYPLEGSPEETNECPDTDQVRLMDGHQTDGLSKTMMALMDCLNHIKQQLGTEETETRRPGDRVGCWSCGSIGHWIEDCPQRRYPDRHPEPAQPGPTRPRSGPTQPLRRHPRISPRECSGNSDCAHDR